MNYILILSGLDFDALDLALWQYGSWSFQTGGTKLKTVYYTVAVHNFDLQEKTT